MKLATLTAIAMLAASGASASEFVWKNSKHWQITGSTDLEMCVASTVYPATGAVFQIDLNRTGYSLSFKHPRSKRLVPGERYNLPVFTDRGNFGTLVGVAIAQDMLVMNGLTYQSVVNLSKAYWIQINDFGRFNLIGSAEAINELHNCVEAANNI